MRITCYILLASLVLCSFRKASKVRYPEVVKAAETAMPSLLKGIPAGYEKQFGFTNLEEIKTAHAGTPYSVVSLVYTGDQYIIPANEWRVPVVSGNTHHLLITVNSNGQQYTAGDMGGAVLARELQQATAKLNRKHTFCILRIYQLKADFLVEMRDANYDHATYYPLRSAAMALQGKQQQAYTLSQLTTTLQPLLNAAK